MKQYESVMKYGAAIHNKEADKENEIAINKYEDYKGYDWNKGFEFSAKSLEQAMFAADFDKVTELKDVKRGHNPQHITLFESLGLGIEDVLAAGYVYEQARARGIGVELPE